MDLAFLLIPVLFISACYLFWKRRRKTLLCPLPPGPEGLWGLGNLYSENIDAIHLAVDKWGERYGRIFHGSLFGTSFVFLNDADLIRKAFTSAEFDDSLNDRPPVFANHYIVNNSDIIIGRFSEKLIKLRKIFHNSLGAYGDGVQRFEDIIQTEIKRSLEKLESSREGNVDLKTYFKHSLSNVVSILLRGEPFEDGDPDIELFWEYDSWSQRLIHPSIDKVLGVFPFLRFLPGKYGTTFRNVIQKRDAILEKFCHGMKRTYIPGENRGLVDVFFSVKEKQKAEGMSWFTDDHVHGLTQDIIAAALTTSFESLTGLFLVLLHQQEIQTSIQSEIDRVIGSDRAPTIQDRNDMPYTQATILETLRYISQVPISIPHHCSKDVVLEGYTIQKGSIVLPYFWGIHHNKNIWDNPWTMNPRRFLDDEGNLLPPEHPKRQAMLSFGIGRRQCLGEAFAKSRLFLYITNLLQRFNFLPPDGVNLPSPDPREYESGGVTIVPPDYVCRLESRQ